MIMSIVNYYLCKKLLCTFNVLKSIQSDFKNKWVPFDLFSKDAKSKVLFLIFCSKFTKLLQMNRKIKNIIIIFSIKSYCILILKAEKIPLRKVQNKVFISIRERRSRYVKKIFDEKRKNLTEIKRSEHLENSLHVLSRDIYICKKILK